MKRRSLTQCRCGEPWHVMGRGEWIRMRRNLEEEIGVQKGWSFISGYWCLVCDEVDGTQNPRNQSLRWNIRKDEPT